MNVGDLKGVNIYKYSSNMTDQFVQRDAMPHPAVQIFFWICLLAAVQILHGYTLFLLAGVLLLLALKFCAMRFILLLRRTRWILFSIFFIYAYSSSGDALWLHLGIFSPAIDGVVDGLLQVLRLLGILAGLSLLLTTLSQSQLIAGLYSLFYPLRYLGLSRDRVAVRLALTLHYAESGMLAKYSNWKDSAETMLRPAEIEDGDIYFNTLRFTNRDWLLVVVSSALILGIII